jgi:hypothetical protein
MSRVSGNYYNYNAAWPPAMNITSCRNQTYAS